MDGGGPVLSAWGAGGRDRVLGQELAGEEERAQTDLVTKAKERELDAWERLKVYSPVHVGTQAKDVVDTRWVLTWKEVGGKKTEKARLAAEGNQGPDLRDGSVRIARCANRRSPQLQLISLSA